MNGIIKGGDTTTEVKQDTYGNLTRHTHFGAFCLFQDTGDITFIPNFTEVTELGDVYESRYEAKFRPGVVNGRKCDIRANDIIITGDSHEKA